MLTVSSPVLRLVFVVASLQAACSYSGAPTVDDPVDRSLTLVLHQEPFTVDVYDLGGDGVGPGDLYTWVAPVTVDDGRSGTIVGEHQVVAVPTEGTFREVRIGTSVIDLGNSDTIALGGLIPVTAPLGQIEAGVELANAVIGGTGVFVGAKGEIQSVRAEDGSWTHTLSYEVAGAADPERAFTAEHSWDERNTAVVDLNGNGAAEAGDLRVFHVVGTTDAGQPIDVRGAGTLIAVPGADGTILRPFGYGLHTLGDDLMVGLIFPAVAADTGVLVDSIPPSPIVGGTGRFATSRGTYSVGLREGGTAQSFQLHTEPTGTVAQTIVFRSDLQVVRLTDRGGSGESFGDQRTWALPFTDEAGQPMGTAYGYATTIVPASDGTPVRTVVGLIAVQLDDGSTILVADLHTEDAALPNAADAAVTRPVLGGTGEWAGISGELVTTLDGAGGLIHTFTLQGPARE